MAGCGAGWKGPKPPVEPLPSGMPGVAAEVGPPRHEQWTYQSSTYLARPPAALGHFLALGDRKGKVHFLDPNTGKSRATIKAKGAIRHDLVFDASRLFVVTEHAGRPLQAFRLDGGKQIWYRKFSYPPERPIMAGEELWLPVGDTIYALDPETGDPLRTVWAGDDLWYTPVRLGDGWLLWGRHGVLVALGSLGTRQWSVDLNAACSEPPVISGDTLWVSSSSGVLFCIAEQGAVILEHALDSTALFSAQVRPGRLYVAAVSGRVWAMDPLDGSILWERSLAAPLSGPPVLHEDWMAVARLDGRLDVLELATGTPVESLNYSSIIPFAPVWAFGRLFVVDSNRRVHALGAQP